jgi:hypothetical protein
MFSMTKRQRQADDTPPQRRNRARPIGDDVTLVGREAFVRSGFTDSALILHWTEIVGPEVARMARPVKLAESAGGGVLTLKAEPAASVFLLHETRTLCDTINAYLGRQAVQRIRFVAGSLLAADSPRKAPPAPPAAPSDDPACRFEGPEELKAALIGLARLRQRAAGDRGD